MENQNEALEPKKVRETKEIKLSELRAFVEEGKKRAWLAEYYGISELQMASALKQAGLRIRKFHVPAFKLVDDSAETTKDVVQDITNPVINATTDEPTGPGPKDETVVETTVEVQETVTETKKSDWG